MISAIVALSILAASARVSEAPTWTKMFDMPGPGNWISSVRATGPDDWVVGGKWGVTRVSGGGAPQTRETPGHPVLGLYSEGSAEIFAVGNGELVLHFDGKTWTEEHVGPTPKIDRGENLLQGAFRADDKSSVIAFGPQLVLVRQSDATWANPTVSERSRVSQLAQGWLPNIARPMNCDRGLWLWGSRARAWFECQDGRGFVYDTGEVVPWGQRPAGCKTVTTAGLGKDAAYVSCANRTLWKTDAKTWRSMTAPPDKTRELVSISVAGACVFVASPRALWRSCTPGP